MVEEVFDRRVSPSEIVITQNYWGERILNVTALQKLGIKPQAKNLRGVELMRSAEEENAFPACRNPFTTKAQRR